MLFNTVEFAFFLPIVLLGVFTLPEKGRIAFLLLASYFFYGFAKPEYIFLMLLHTGVAYVCSRGIEDTNDPHIKKIYLVANIVVACGILFIFKYFNFFNQAAAETAEVFGFSFSPAALHLILPIGISFYTFQTLSYTIDVYRKDLHAERSFWRLALFVSFFPHLVAGPILRAAQLLPQIVKRQKFDADRISSGFALILLGLVKKVVIADRLAIYSDTVFADPSQQPGQVLILAVYFFAIQIYCDFSGYSDIAVGAARMMGIDLIENFKRPYLSTSPHEFWRRWHISLSTWVRDYLYLPLGGNRCSIKRWVFNILAVFALSGLWHGANWTFIAWGLFHGFLLLATHWLTPLLKKLTLALKLREDSPLLKAMAIFVTFHLVCLGWVLFRAQSISDAWACLSGMFHITGNKWMVDGALPHHQMLLCVASVLGLLSAEIIWEKYSWSRQRVETLPLVARWTLAIGAVFLVLLFPGADEARQFIYFAF